MFKDTDVFYEDLRNGVNDWGQRISVDQWHYYSQDSRVLNYGCGYACIKGNARQSIFEVDAGFAKSKMEELENNIIRRICLSVILLSCCCQSVTLYFRVHLVLARPIILLPSL